MPSRSIRSKSDALPPTSRLLLTLLLAAPAPWVQALEWQTIDYAVIRPRESAPPPVVVVRYSAPEPLPILVVGPAPEPAASGEDRVFAEITAALKASCKPWDSCAPDAAQRTPLDAASESEVTPAPAPGFARQREQIEL